MILRTLIVQLYIVACVAAVVVDFFLPALYLWLLVALLAWFAIGFYVYRQPSMNRPVFGSAPTPAPATRFDPAGAPGHLGFCVYCAALMEPGSPVCASCGRTNPGF